MIIQHNKSQDGKSKIHNVVYTVEVDLKNRIIKQISHGILRTIFLIVKYVTNSVELLKIRRKKKKTILTLFHSSWSCLNLNQATLLVKSVDGCFAKVV